MERTDREKQRPSEKPVVESTLEIVSIVSRERRVIYRTQGRIEAPNSALQSPGCWTRFGPR